MAFTPMSELFDSSTIPVEFCYTKIVDSSDRIPAEYLDAFFPKSGVSQRHVRYRPE
jgi:hypothetical protein